LILKRKRARANEITANSNQQPKKNNSKNATNNKILNASKNLKKSSIPVKTIDS